MWCWIIWIILLLLSQQQRTTKRKRKNNNNKIITTTDSAARTPTSHFQFFQSRLLFLLSDSYSHKPSIPFFPCPHFRRCSSGVVTWASWIHDTRFETSFRMANNVKVARQKGIVQTGKPHGVNIWTFAAHMTWVRKDAIVHRTSDDMDGTVKTPPTAMAVRAGL